MTAPLCAAALPPPAGVMAYRLRWKRRRFLWRAFRARRQLTPRQDLTSQIKEDDLLLVLVLRNEATRLPYFLHYYRKLGVNHFLVVDNNSSDGSSDLLMGQGDVSLWHTDHSYRATRFGVDWSNWLLMRYGHGHWCLTVDADELLTYDGASHQDLKHLTALLQQQGREAFGAMMLDLYPKGTLDQQGYHVGQDPCDLLRYFDAAPYRVARQAPLGNLWIQGGARERMFFQEIPHRSPTLNKIPLLFWNRRYAYLNSTHSMLPPRLNGLYCGPGGGAPSGVLLHTKFLPEIVSKSATEKQRGEHFLKPMDFAHYYDGLSAAPDLWAEKSFEYNGPDQLKALGLLPALPW